MPNEYAIAARRKKVNALAKLIRESGIKPEDMRDADWETAARGCGVNPPSLETRGAVMVRLEQEAAGVKYCTCGRPRVDCVASNVGGDPELKEHGDQVAEDYWPS